MAINFRVYKINQNTHNLIQIPTLIIIIIIIIIITITITITTTTTTTSIIYYSIQSDIFECQEMIF
jgi:hypothetical protein